MKNIPGFRTAFLAGLMHVVALSPAAAQQLIAWPMGGASWMRTIMPGLPILRPLPRPIPPRPVPPRPGPLPRPVPRPVPRPTPRPTDSRPLELSGYHVEGRVTGQAAELTYVIRFHNPTGRRLEGVLIQPIPADTVLSGFTMTAGGKTLKGELLEAGQAATIYENIVRQMRDPGLLELVGERMIRARVFPIEPRSDIVVRMKVSQVLKRSGELYSLSIPMRSATMTGSVTKGASAKLTLSADAPIGTLYSPMPGVKVERNGEREAVVTYEADKDAPADMSLFYSLRRDPLAAGILSHREKGEDGFFLLSLAPKREASAGEAVPKDILFIMDRSGSMEDGGKMEQAKGALSYCIRKLGERDRFGIVDFATGADIFESRLVAATEDNKARALRYVRRIEAAGGTNIEAALEEGLSILPERSERVPMVFFLTDGLPTVGETDVEQLLRLASGKNRALRARVFTFGVGDDVNTLLLDKLADSNRGARDYVRPGEDIEVKVSALYSKVAKPALTDVKLEWKGVEVSDMYPRPVTDIFFGSELTLMGRYHGGGKGRLVVTGKAAGKRVRFEYPVSFPKEEDLHGFLPRLWANMKVAHELDAIRLSGTPDPEVVKSVVKLAKRYGIVTPYTSYLITEEGEMRMGRDRAAMDAVRRMRADAFSSGRASAAGPEESKRLARRAQGASSLFMAAKSALSFAGGGLSGAASSAEAVIGLEEDARKELRDKGIRAVATRSVGAKTFYLRGGVWTDGALDDDSAAKARTVRYLSDEYFDLPREHPGLGRYLSLGPRVTVLFKGTVYKIVE